MSKYYTGGKGFDFGSSANRLQLQHYLIQQDLISAEDMLERAAIPDSSHRFKMYCLNVVKKLLRSSGELNDIRIETVEKGTS